MMKEESSAEAEVQGRKSNNKEESVLQPDDVKTGNRARSGENSNDMGGNMAKSHFRSTGPAEPQSNWQLFGIQPMPNASHDPWTQATVRSQPGAHAVCTPRFDNPVLRDPDYTTRSRTRTQSDPQENTELANGSAVTNHNSDQCLAEAELVLEETNHQQARPMAENSFPFWRALVFTVIGVLLVGGIVVASLCGNGFCKAKTSSVLYSNASRVEETLAPTAYSRGTVEAVNIEWEIKHLLGREYFDTVTGNHSSDLVLQARQKALQWILHEDPLQLDTSDAQKLLQRFILVLFYCQTTLQQQWTECNPPNELTTGFCYYPEESSLASGLTAWGDYWLSGSHECQWAGVECTASREIAVLTLQHNGLNGPLPWELSKLTQLKVLDLKSNRISGTITTEIGAFASTLEGLILESNSLVGSIPTELFSSVALAGGNQYLHLRILNLRKNSLTGPIPSEVGLSKWRMLFLNNNLLSSSLPIEVFNSQYLEHFHIAGNSELTGTLPSFVHQMTNLQFLVFDGTGLSGTLPSELALMSNLIHIGVSDTNIGGTIPDALYTGLSDLQFLDLHGCQLSGTISTQLGLLSKLQIFYIADNGFTGTLPEEIGRLTNLGYVTLNGNNWTTGSVVSESFCESRVVARVHEIVADCTPDPSTGVALMECPEHCCTACCDPSTGICVEN